MSTNNFDAKLDILFNVPHLVDMLEISKDLLSIRILFCPRPARPQLWGRVLVNRDFGVNSEA